MTIQPSQLLRFYGIEKFQNDGLLSRIVPCFSIGSNPNGELCIDGARNVYSKVIKFILNTGSDTIKSGKCFKIPLAMDALSQVPPAKPGA